MIAEHFRRFFKHYIFIVVLLCLSVLFEKKDFFEGTLISIGFASLVLIQVILSVIIRLLFGNLEPHQEKDIIAKIIGVAILIGFAALMYINFTK